MHFLSIFSGAYKRFCVIPLFAGKPSHPFVPLSEQTASARSAGQGRPQAGACALPLTEASTMAGFRLGGVGGIVAPALLLLTCLVTASLLPSCVSARSLNEHQRAMGASYAAYVDEASLRFGVPKRWIYAVMRAESAGYSRATSPVGAMGLMQLMPATWASLRLRHGLGSNVYDPHDNILAGAAYLREMHDKYGTPGFLAAYNAGPGRYEEYLAGRRPLPAETRAYVATIAPGLGSERTFQPVVAVAATLRSWVLAPLFIFQSNSASSVGRAPIDLPLNHRAKTLAPPDVPSMKPHSQGLFVARADGLAP